MITSERDPLIPVFLPPGALRGVFADRHLGYVAAPGRTGRGGTGAYQRDLDADLANLRGTHGVGCLICLATEEEAASDAMGTPIPRLKEAVQRHGLTFFHVPVAESADLGSEDVGRALIKVQFALLAKGKGGKVVLSARGRRGRPVMTLTRYLAEAGYVGDRIVELLREADPDALPAAAEERIRSTWLDVQRAKLPFTVSVREALLNEHPKFGTRLPDQLDLVFTRSNGSIPVTVRVQETNHRVVFLARLPFKAPAAKRATAAELASRLNWDLAWGAFEVGFGDGTIRLRLSHEYGKQLVPNDDIVRMHKHALATANSRLPAFGAIVHGDSTAADAMKAKA